MSSISTMTVTIASKPTQRSDEQTSSLQLASSTKKEKTALEAISQGVMLPGVPTFTMIDSKRRWMLEHMAGAFRVFSRKGYTEGMSGHISLRDPEYLDCFWTNPLGLHFGLVTVSDLIMLNHSGTPVGGNMSRPANAAGFQIHSVIHKKYPHVNAACHTHSPCGKAWSTFARPLDMINQDVTMFYGSAQGVYEEFGGVVLDEQESERLANSLGEKGKILILRNHGLLSVGSTVDEAAYLFTLAERSCEIQLKVDAAAALGTPKRFIDDEAAAYTFRMTSDPETLYCEFQPDLEYEKSLCGGSYLK